MKAIERRIQELERQSDAEDDFFEFDVRFVEPGMGEIGRMVSGKGGSQTWYQPDGNGGWRQIDGPT